MPTAVTTARRAKIAGLPERHWHDELPRKVLSFLFLGATALLAVVPLWHVTVAAVGAGLPAGETGGWLQVHPTLDNFYMLMTQTGFLRWLANSLFVAGAVTAVGVTLSATAGYALSRFRFFGRMTVLHSMLVTQIFPATMLLLPIFLLLVRWQLINTFFGLMLVYLATILPFCIWQMKSFYDSVPESIEEAASMDGCTPGEIFRRVVLPISAPGLAVTALFSFAAVWNEYVVAAIIMQDSENFTLPIGLRLLYEDGSSTQPGLFAAGALLVTVPMLGLYLLLSRLFLYRVRDISVRV
jgi:arabinogalactan oligomer / maltooligosaccharide transport system permease protein